MEMEKEGIITKKEGGSRKIWLAVAAVVLVVVIVAIVIIVIPKKHCNGLIGKWKYSGTDYEGEFIYNFGSNGEGTYDTPMGNYTFVFEDDKDTFSALYPGNTQYSTYPYSISEDNEKLTIIDSLGDPVEYICL